ncbi:efflux RND transporter permease subunit, partial [Paraburkholderia tuberum]
MNSRDQEPVRESAPVPSAGADKSGEGSFNLSAWALRHQQLVIFLIGLATLFGVIGYTQLAQSEDPPFTFRTMVIKTYWPGASAREVQEQITDRIGRQLQAAPNIDYIKSYSR